MPLQECIGNGGVPPGSILGTTLFLLYTYNIAIYADDIYMSPAVSLTSSIAKTSITPPLLYSKCIGLLICGNSSILYLLSDLTI